MPPHAHFVRFGGHKRFDRGRVALSEFEFISVLISMVVGLGVTHVLRGFAQVIHERKQAPVDGIHMVWTAVVTLNLALNWWVLFDHAVWSFTLFLSLVVWVVTLYLPVAFLYPPRKDASEGWAAVFAGNRQWFLGAFASFAAADIWITALRGGLFDPPAYLPLVGHYFILWVVGIFVARPSFQRFLAWYSLLSLLLWSLVARRFLT
jgi:hypothetical protein